MGWFGKKKRQKEAGLQEPLASKMVYQGRKNEKREKSAKWKWAYMGLALCAVCAVILQNFYGVFRTNAEKNMSNPIENTGNIFWLYQNCYLLYRDLYNAQHNEQISYMDLYLEADEDKQWLLDTNKLNEYRSALEEAEEHEAREQLEGFETGVYAEEADTGAGVDGIAAGTRPDDSGIDAAGPERIGEITYSDCEILESELSYLQQYFREMEDYFRNLNSNYDYFIQDNTTGKYVTNMSTADRNRGNSELYFRLSFSFDSSGNVTIGDTICGMDITQIRKYANEAIRNDMLEDLTGKIREYASLKTPVDCTVTYVISREAWTKKGVGDDSSDFGTWGGYLVTSSSGFHYYSYNYENAAVEAYQNSGTSGIILICLAGMFCLGFLLPLPGNTKPWKEVRICTFPVELLWGIGICIAAAEEGVIALIAHTASGRAYTAVGEYLPAFAGMSHFLVGVFNLLVITLFLFSGWYLGICARALREFGIIHYISQRSMIYRFFPFVKRKAAGIYRSILHLDLTKNAHRTILKILLVNGCILFFISCLWFGGLAITVVYSLVLYVILRKYVSDLQEKYKILFQAVDEIAAGNLNVTIMEDLGVFEPFRNEIYKIQEGLKKAVTMEVKSQRIKTELVTNMSHDLKTPLTAIITYVNLLKKEDVTEVQRAEYLEILERKSLRLKSLIEDLFEFSKANSQNITLNIMDVDIMNLVKQVSFEMSDKISASGLDVRMNLTEEKVVLPLDSQKTYRIYENLFGNIAKYALPGTRVYVNGFRIDDTVVITLKNISAQEITVEASELTERFVRGNASRNTEGSGLGLAIAKSFMELQGGTLELEVDGDLFKVTTTWHVREKAADPNVREKAAGPIEKG